MVNSGGQPRIRSTRPFPISIYFIILMYPLSHPGFCQSELIILNRCCPLDASYQNGTCIHDQGNKNNSGLPATVFNVPDHLSMSAYPVEIRKLNFSLKSLPQPPLCSNGKFSLRISLRNVTEKLANFTLEGYLKFGMDYYAPNEYCVDRELEDFLSVIVCNATCSLQNPCIKRCCEFGEVWDLSGLGPGGNNRLSCKSSGSKQWSPLLYKNPYEILNSKESFEIQPHFYSDHPRNGWCDPSKAIMLPLTDKYKIDTRVLFRVLKDGSIVQKLRALTWEPIAQNLTCIDGAQNFPGYSEAFYTGDSTDTLIMDCRAKSTIKIPISNLYRIAMIVACVFLFFTITVYVLLWDKQNVHGWSILCYISSLFFMYISLCLMNFSKELNFTLAKNTGGGGIFCYVIGVSIHFFFFSTFCWLTVINFDLWWTFRALKPTAGKSKGLKRFLLYSVFAVGAPIIVVSVALALDLKYRDDITSDVIVPLYGRTRCYMEQHKPMLVYVYGPIAVLISLNMIFFVFTMYSMYQIQRSTKFASSSSSKTHQQNQSAKLFFKLFIVMGVSWVSEVVSWALSEEGKVEWYFVIFDMINILQAILIFVIFVCKRETLTSLKQKYPKFGTPLSFLTRESEGNNLSSTKSTRTELSFTDTTTASPSGGDHIEMSTNPSHARPS